jgi:hypothetical protein
LIPTAISSANIAYRVRFSYYKDGAQTVTLRRVEGEQAADNGDGGRVIVDGCRFQ